MKLSFLSLAALVPFAAAHFKLDYPPSRGFDEDTMPSFPCGGMSQSSKRMVLSLSEDAIPVALTMGHSQTAVQVLLGLGNNPGDNFNITLVPTFRLTGLGAFCLPHVSLDEKTLGVPLTDGMNATLQVVTNGDPNGGLYACADITFSKTVQNDNPTNCKNNTGVSATPFSGAAAARNANESTADGQAQSGAGSSPSGSGAAAPTSTGGAVPLETAPWGIVGAAIVGGLAVL